MKTGNVTEAAVKDRIKVIVNLYAKYNPVYTLCPMTFGYGESGHPDRIVLINSKLLGIEAKRDSNNHHSRPELKPKSNEVAQKRQAAKIKEAGGHWLCIHKDNLTDLTACLDNLCVCGSSTFEPDDKLLLTRVVTWM